MFKKYWAIFQLEIQLTMTYRSELMVWILLDAVPTFIFFFIWQKVFSNSPVIDGYDLSKMIEFYFYFLIINNVTSSHFEQTRVQQIREGKIDLYLVKPLPYLQKCFWDFLGSKVVYLLLVLPFYAIIIYLCQKYFHIHFSSFTLNQLLQFLTLMVFGLLTEFFLGTLVVLAGFWVEGAAGLEHFKWIVVSLFGGSLMPDVFLPQWLRTITAVLPFQFMYQVPIEIMQLHRSLQLSEVAYMTLFIGSLLVITLLLWQKAKIRYTSAGG